MFSRFVTPMLLFMVISPLLTLVISPQQGRTYTSTVGFTTVLTSTSYGNSTIGTFTVQQQSLYSGPFTLRATGSQYGCNYRYLPFNVSNPEEITGSLSSNISVSFYVVDDAFIRSWRTCSIYGPQILYSADAVTSLSIDVKINTPGKYGFLLLNYNQMKAANVNLNVGVAGAATTATVTSISHIALTTQFITSTGPSLVMQTVQAFSLNRGMWLGILATAFVICLIIIMLYRRRARSIMKTTKTNVSLN